MKTKVFIVALCLFVAGLLTFADTNTIMLKTEKDFGLNQPVIMWAVSTDHDAAFYSMNRTGTAAVNYGIDEEYGVRRMSEYINPGLWASFGTMVLEKYCKEGLIDFDEFDRPRYTDQAHYDDLHARLMLEIATELQPYLNQLKAVADKRTIEAFALQVYPDVRTINHFPRFSPTWYVPTSAPSGSLWDIRCMQCPKPDGSVHCPGMCIDKCADPGFKCDIVIVPAPKPKNGTIDLEPY